MTRLSIGRDWANAIISPAVERRSYNDRATKLQSHPIHWGESGFWENTGREAAAPLHEHQRNRTEYVIAKPHLCAGGR